MHQSENLGSNEPASDLICIIVRLRMITMDCTDAAGSDVAVEKFPGVAHRESKIGQAALVAPPGGIANDHGQDVQSEVIVCRPPHGAADQESPVAATQVQNNRG